MPADMLELQEFKLHGLEELIVSHPGNEAASEEDAAIAQFFVDEALALRRSASRLWDHEWTRAVAGKAGDRSARGAKLRAFLERTGVLLNQYAALAKTYADRSNSEVASLPEVRQQSDEFSTWVEECLARWALLDRPRKPINRDTVAAAQAAFQRGECEDTSAILARLTDPSASLIPE